MHSCADFNLLLNPPATSKIIHGQILTGIIVIPTSDPLPLLKLQLITIPPHIFNSQNTVTVSVPAFKPGMGVRSTVL